MKPIRDYEPCDMKWVRHKNPRNTICNDLREIYYQAEAMGNERIMLLARIAISKAKSMINKLKEYNKNAVVQLYKKNE